MRYWEDMQSKYGFNDGESVPPDALLARQLYVRAVNAAAARRGSSVRAVAYDRPGVHNPVLVLTVSAEDLERVGGDALSGELPSRLKEIPPDAEFQDAVGECMDLDLDDFLVVTMAVRSGFDLLEADLRNGTFTCARPPSADPSAESKNEH